MAETRGAEAAQTEPGVGDADRVPKRAGVTRIKGRTHRSLRAVLWAPVEAVLMTLALRTSSHVEVLGIGLRAVTVPDGMEPLFFAKVQRALEMIERYDPRRLTRIRHDVRSIGGTAGGPHEYHHSIRAIMLSWPGVLQESATELAMTIIHEATHGRISDRGIRYEEPMRGRIEAACVAQEAAFARRLPCGDVLAETKLKTLQRPWWTPEELHRLSMMGARAHELPEWLLRWLDAVGRRRLERDKDDASAATESDEER